MDDDRKPQSLPVGFRQGIITAITVLLGFSLALFQFWSFEASGHWTWPSIFAAGAMVLAVVMQIVALVRSLRLQDDDPREYRTTVSWLTASTIVMLVGMLFATIVFSGSTKP